MAMDDVTDDSFLGGRLTLRQLRRGHRAGHDAMLLAAAVPAVAGERVADAGAGIGAAGLALAARMADVAVTLIEREGELVGLARHNIRHNGLDSRVSCVEADIAELAAAPQRFGLVSAAFDHVMMNPPYHDSGRHRPSPDALRALAHVAADGLLRQWVEAAVRLLAAKGRLTLIWRADGLSEVLEALRPHLGGVTVLPVHSRPDRPAIRVLVWGRRGSRAPLVLMPGLVLQDETGRPSAAAEAILRGGGAVDADEGVRR